MINSKLIEVLFRIDYIISKIFQPVIHGICALSGRSNFEIARFLMYTFGVTQLVWLVYGINHKSAIHIAVNVFFIIYFTKKIESWRKSITSLEKRTEDNDGTIGISLIDYTLIVVLRVGALALASAYLIKSDFFDAVSFLIVVLCLYSLFISRPRRRSVVMRLLGHLSLRVTSPQAQ